MAESKYPKLFFNIVLVTPEIPQNTGTIGRSCVGAWCKLHLVGKLGFTITDTQLKRAGLDYWQHLDFVHHPDWQTWWDLVEDPTRVFYFSTKAKHTIFDVLFRPGDWFVFGPETRGLDEKLLRAHSSQALKIPIVGKIRSYNLSNAVSMVLTEGMRQNRDFLGV